MFKSHSSYKLILVMTLACLSGCNFSNNDQAVVLEESSASGAAAALVMSAVYTGNPVTAMSGNTCPTVQSTVGCTVTAANTVTLSYNSCTFGTGAGTRVGSPVITATGLTCGASTMPASATIQYFGNAWQASSNGVMTSFDDSTLNIGNYDGQAVTPILNSAYGVSVNYSSSVPTSVNFARRLYTPSTNYSVKGSATISGGAISASGVTIYDNKNYITGTATFTSVGFTSNCCYPVSGQIVTAFAAGQNQTQPITTLGIFYVGKTETLTFTGCGTATLKDPYGYTSTLAFAHCY